MKNIGYILFFISLCSITAQESGAWELKKHKDSIDIYTRDRASSSFKEFKAISVFDTSFEDLLQQLYEAPYYSNNTDYNISYLIDDLVMDGTYFYYKQDLPWPLMNRDVVTKLTVIKKTDTYIKLAIESVPDLLDPEPQTIRITELSGFWLLEKVPEGIKATQQIHMDPAGRVPPFIVNPLLVKGPFKTFNDLHNKLDTGI